MCIVFVTTADEQEPHFNSKKRKDPSIGHTFSHTWDSSHQGNISATNCNGTREISRRSSKSPRSQTTLESNQTPSLPHPFSSPQSPSPTPCSSATLQNQNPSISFTSPPSCQMPRVRPPQIFSFCLFFFLFSFDFLKKKLKNLIRWPHVNF
jgi:hypothetical protein